MHNIKSIKNKQNHTKFIQQAKKQIDEYMYDGKIRAAEKYFDELSKYTKTLLSQR